jgi:tRNA threonylcarbamoyl adenosine modification protein YjeE
MATCISHSAAETESLGAAWGRSARPGWVIGLSGDLGTGKTQLVKGLARGLGATERVHSPTFPLVNEYTTGRLALYHLDLYRLETPEQIHAAGLEDFLTPDGVTVVEWAERFFVREHSTSNIQHPTPNPNPGTRWRWVVIEALNETERRISYEDFGA